jgi:glyceraldehyde 3-phosphate dehydrogenase
MPIKLGINGFGRIGRLSMRVAWEMEDVQVIQINDPGGDAATLAHLLNYDSVHGRWQHNAISDGEEITVADKKVSCTHNRSIAETDWSDCDVVIEASGKFKRKALLKDYLDQGVKRVVVTAPIKEEGVLDVVLGVNDNLYDPRLHPIVSAASCTTNCLAPVVKVIHEKLGIRHGSMTSIHNITSTQTIRCTAQGFAPC